MSLGRSFRIRILVVVLAATVVPLLLVGLWLTSSARRSGETLLRSRLTETTRERAEQLVMRWARVRSQALFIAEDPEVQRALLQPARGTAAGPPEAAAERFESIDPTIVVATVADEAGRPLWTFRRPDDRAEPRGERMPFTLPIYERASGDRIGALVLAVDAGALVVTPEIAPAAAGMVLGAVGSTTGFSYVPLPFDPLLLESDRFSWGGAEWLAVRRTLGEPPLTLVAAAPVSDFLLPFEGAARRGTVVLVLVSVGAIGLASILTSRMTRSLRGLSAAAEAVAAGDLERRVAQTGDDEVGRVARAFNTMTENLRRTLGELAKRESFAAVGEFAATLAHEVRNPLTAIRINLQYADEGLAAGSGHREAQERALSEIRRLDETVTRALKVARSGHIATSLIDLREPLRAAADVAHPSFARRKATLDLCDLPDEISIQGDAAAIEQLFLNLLRNAAQALDAGGHAEVAVEMTEGGVVVEIRDDGVGIPDSIRSRVFEPLFTTRSEGTGLGLPVARRIAVAHGGGIELDQRVGGGTVVRVRLPLLDPDEPDRRSPVDDPEAVTVRRPNVTDHYAIHLIARISESP